MISRRPVGADEQYFIAVSELPVPSTSLPTTQDELLATLLHPIVSFIVLGSVIVRTYSQRHIIHVLIDSLRWPLHSCFLVRQERSTDLCLSCRQFHPDIYSVAHGFSYHDERDSCGRRH